MLTTLLIIAMATAAWAQCTGSVDACHGSGGHAERGRHRIEAEAAYGYNSTMESYGSIGLTYSGRAAQWLQLTGGVYAATSDNYAVKARADFMWRTDRRGKIAVRNQYLYNVYAYAGMQGFDAAVMAAYDHDYFYVGIGATTRFFAPTRGARGVIYEPIDLAYDVEGRIFPKEHVWNIALQITNMQPFRTGRFHEPEVTVKGNCTVYEGREGRFRAMLRASYQAAGLLSMAMNFYGIEITAGVICEI